jgi:hypothetical protein
MATPNPHLISSIRKTIQKLKNGSPYQWGHMGACNCGNLAQELTNLNKGDIHQLAMQGVGDWSEQLRDYCPTSGYPMDSMITKLLESGLTLDDLTHLERLSDPKVLAGIPEIQVKQLSKNNRLDVIRYMEVWVKQLENQWIEINTRFDKMHSEKINHTGVLS